MIFKALAAVGFLFLLIMFGPKLISIINNLILAFQNAF